MIGRAPPRVLIVDDERIVARDLQKSLNEMGYDAFAVAASAAEALDCVQAAAPDVVLMDVRIKGAPDGIDTADLLNQKFSTSIIYLTAHADPATLDRAKRTDPHGYLIKPVRLVELGSMLESALHLRRLDHALREALQRGQALAERLAAVREEERRDVASMLHDGIAQDLFVLELDLGRLQPLVRRRAGARKLLAEIEMVIRQCMGSIRQTATDLRPVALAHCSVFDVIADHANHFGERSKLKIDVVQMTPCPPLAEAVQLLLFRAAQEALTNVARHARATTVHLMLRREGERIAMEITDDGVGIEDGATNKPHSLGLWALRERCSALGGDLTVRRAQPSGTTMLVHLPLPGGERHHAA